MRIGSLFSGIGGLDLGVERATGGHVVWHCEKEQYCRDILALHWPHVPCFEDVVGLEPPPVDMLIGGFPCQDISQAGKREGIHGRKSGLWAEYARIIRLLRPGLVFVENVRALTVRGLDVVLGDLATCGYDAQWDVLGARCVGAPHRRERLFLLAYPQVGVPDACSDSIREQRERRGRERGEPGAPVTGDDGGDGAVADADSSRQSVGADLRAGESISLVGSQVAHADGGGRQGQRFGGILDRERETCGGDTDGRSGP